MILHKISVFFNWIVYAFPVKVCILINYSCNVHHTKKWKVYQIPLASKFLYFNVLNQSHLLLSKNDIHQLLPYIFKRQP